jgi:hypothetical protein
MIALALLVSLAGPHAPAQLVVATPRGRPPGRAADADGRPMVAAFRSPPRWAVPSGRTVRGSLW